MPSPIPRWTRWVESLVGRRLPAGHLSPATTAFPRTQMGRRPRPNLSGPHRRFTCVTACLLAGPPSGPLRRRLRRLRDLRRRSDCYRLERPSCRAGVAPAEDSDLFTAHYVPFSGSPISWSIVFLLVSEGASQGHVGRRCAASGNATPPRGRIQTVRVRLPDSRGLLPRAGKLDEGHSARSDSSARSWRLESEPVAPARSGSGPAVAWRAGGRGLMPPAVPEPGPGKAGAARPPSLKRDQ